MVCAPVRSIIPSLKLGDYLSIQAHKPCSISHKENHAALKHVKKKNNSCSFKNYVNLFDVDAFFVHEFPPIVFKRFSTRLHYSVMTQMIVAFINTFLSLNINLLMN